MDIVDRISCVSGGHLVFDFCSEEYNFLSSDLNHHPQEALFTSRLYGDFCGALLRLTQRASDGGRDRRDGEDSSAGTRASMNECNGGPPSKCRQKSLKW